MQSGAPSALATRRFRFPFSRSSRRNFSFTFAGASILIRNLLLDALGGIPRSLQFANVEDLSDVVSVMGADVADGGGDLGEFLVVGGLDQLFEIGHDLVELLDRVGPLLVVELGEGLVIVAGELGRGLSLKALKVLAIPEQ